MVNLLPAILIGGPPHAGKSVLFYSLTKTLHEHGVHHHAIRACPDGEGNWYQEIHRELDPESIRLLRIKRAWTASFVQGISRDLAQRHLPLLVDMGGRPTEWQMGMLQACTHSLLLLKRDEPQSADFWRELALRAGLLPLAEIFSTLEGESSIATTEPVLTGTLANLQRGIPAQGKLFDALVERISSLFSSYSLAELEQAKLAMAPAEFTINLALMLHRFDPEAKAWTPDMLQRLSGELPAHAPLAVYGRGPGWLYGMIAAHADQAAFYQFDPRIGWLAPPALSIGAPSPSEEIAVRTREYQEDAFILTIHIANEYLDHLQIEQLAFPPVPAGRGLILDGKMPHWLLTALVRLYASTGVEWLACYQPTLKGAVVVASHVPAHTTGEVIPLPVFDQSGTNGG